MDVLPCFMTKLGLPVTDSSCHWTLYDSILTQKHFTMVSKGQLSGLVDSVLLYQMAEEKQTDKFDEFSIVSCLPLFDNFMHRKWRGTDPINCFKCFLATVWLLICILCLVLSNSGHHKYRLFVSDLVTFLRCIMGQFVVL